MVSKEFSQDNESQCTVSTPGKGFISKVSVNREKATGVSPPIKILNHISPELSVSPRYSEDEEDL